MIWPHIEGRWYQIAGLFRELLGTIARNQDEVECGKHDQLVGRIRQSSSLSLEEADYLADAFFLSVSPHREASTASPQREDADLKFASSVLSVGMSQVKLGRLAVESWGDPLVKEFARRMIAHHSKANCELHSIAMRSNLTIPSVVSRSERARYEKLAKLSGTPFDKAYARETVDGHEEDVAAFQRELTNGRNEELKDFAAKMLPALQTHLHQALEMLRSVERSDEGERTRGQPFHYAGCHWDG